MAEIIMKTSRNELKNVFVMKLSEQSLNINKIALHPVKTFLAEGFKLGDVRDILQISPS